MKKFRNVVKGFISKHGSAIAACAFVFTAFAANSSCIIPFYEPEEPKGLEKFKKFSK